MMYKRLVTGLVSVATVALAASLGSATASAAPATVDKGRIIAIAEDVALAAGPTPTGKLTVTVHNNTNFQDEGRFLLHLPQTARLTPGQQCVLYDWNLSLWLCEGARLEARESHTTSLTVRSIINDPDYHGSDVGYVKGLANSNATSNRDYFNIHWPAAPL